MKNTIKKQYTAPRITICLLQYQSHLLAGSEYPSEVIVEETVATEEGDYGW